MGIMRMPSIDSDLLYRGCLQGRFDCIVDSSYYFKTGKDLIHSVNNILIYLDKSRIF